MATVQLQHVTKRYGATLAVDDASLTVLSGEFVALLGPSGCGKTSLLRLIAGFERADAGAVRIGGHDVSRAAPEQRNVGMVFQDYALFPHLTVAENVAFGLGGRGRRGERAARAARVAEVLELVGLGDDAFAGRFPHELSGGQQQRIALARALAPSPQIVLLDEPWSAIDPLQRGQMREELAAILRLAGTTVLLVTHDQEEALALADRVALMRDGRVVQVDAPERLYHEPVDRWSAEFVGPANVLGPEAAGALGAQVDAAAREVLVRPELVALAVAPDGPGLVVGREFRGHDVLYRVRLADGTLLSSQRPSNERVALGDRVRVVLHDGPVPTFH
jgi:iron(III) transport system ATP-binding protein